MKSLNMLKRKWKKFWGDSGTRFAFLTELGVYNRLSDEAFLRRAFRARMQKELNLDCPQTYNEKLQWLKLYDRKPEYTMMADKYRVRAYIAEKIGPEYLVPLLGVWDDPEDIDFERLPEQFVLKCNHNSGLGMCICRDKSGLDIKRTREALRRGLRQDYYLFSREWPYKNIERKIICEKYLQDQTGKTALTDYKFYCFNGQVDAVMAIVGKETGHPQYFYFDRDWNLLRDYALRGQVIPRDFTLPRPQNLEEMFEIARKLSAGLVHVRVDLYSCDSRTYFGELTFFSGSGFDWLLPDYTEEHWGELLKLPE